MWIISFAEPFRRYGKKENVDNKGGMLKNEKTRAVGVIYSIFRRQFRLFRYIMAVISVMYLLYGLSEDAAPELMEIDMDSLLEIQAFQEVNYYFNEIMTRDGDMSLRTWNFSRSRALDAAEMWKETAGINGIAVE